MANTYPAICELFEVEEGATQDGYSNGSYEDQGGWEYNADDYDDDGLDADDYDEDGYDVDEDEEDV